jgi:hypothetical protein
MSSLPKLLLDTNGLIDLEEVRENAPYLAALQHAANAGRIQLAVAAISASENQPGGAISQNYSDFEQRKKRLGLGTAIELDPLFYWDVGYWDHCIWGSDHDIAHAEAIREATFPGPAPSPNASEAESRKWRNQLCDAMMVWCCIYYGCDCLVTRDERLLRKKDVLAKLGLRSALHPKHAAALYDVKE